MVKKLLAAIAGLIVAATVVNILSAGRPAHAAPPPSTFKLFLCKSTPASDCDNFGSSSVTLPTDVSAAIETVSALCSAASSDQSVTPGVFVFSLHSTTAGTAGRDVFAPAAATSFQSGGAQHVVSVVNPQALTMYADAGSAVSLTLDALTQTDGANCHVTLNGHYTH